MSSGGAFYLESMANAQTLTDKYRPQTIDDFVFPTTHHLGAALKFLQNPKPDAFLFHGDPGLGKTSLARIMARAAAQDPLAIQSIVGPDLDIAKVRQIAVDCAQRPMFGSLYAVIVDEADEIPRLAQVRLLSLMEDLKHACFFFTSNASLENFEPRFLGRVKPQLFTRQGLLLPGAEMLLRIARQEEIALNKPTAERIVRESKNDLRASIQRLAVVGAETELEPAISV
jgi:replication-associated recombination protein RarA